MPTDKKFTGQILDGTGLYFYNARYYDSTIGRFVSADITVPDPNNPQSMNRYSYVINNPFKYIDPSGLDYIYVAGDSPDKDGELSEEEEKFIAYLMKLAEKTGEKVIIIRDTTLGEKGNASGRVADIEKAIKSGQYTDIKLVGFSEGGAAIALYLNQNSSNLDSNISGAVFIDSSTSILAGTQYTDGEGKAIREAFGNLPSAVGNKIGLRDIWNGYSGAHTISPSGIDWIQHSRSYNSLEGIFDSTYTFTERVHQHTINSWQTKWMVKNFATKLG